MEYYFILLLFTWTLLPGLCFCFNIDVKRAKVIHGSEEAQFGYTVQQHQAEGQKWLLVGAPFESSGDHQTGDVYRCPLDPRPEASCSRLHLGNESMSYVSERKDKMRIGMSLTSNPEDQSFVACGPLWSYECGSAYYSTGICSRVNSSFQFTNNIAPAFQRCETFMDIVIVLDGSNSIYPWYEVQDFLINVLQKFCVGSGQTQVGIVQYGQRVVHEFALDDYESVEEVVQAAQNIQQRGGEETRTALGISSARSLAFKRGGREGARKVMIVITDGESHDSPDLQKVVEDSEKDNITLYAIAVLGYYNRRGINPEAFLKEIKFIATDPDEHFFSVTDESALKDIVDALGEKIFSLEGTNKNKTSFELQMSQAGFSSHIVEDGVLVGAVGAYDWNGAVLKETAHGKVIPPKSSYSYEFPESLKNHGAYLGYTVTSVVSAKHGRLYVSGAPRFNHTGKVIIFTLQNDGNLTILHSLKGQQIGSYFGSEIAPLDVDEDQVTDFLLVAAPMFFSEGWERGRVHVYKVTEETRFFLVGSLEVAERAENRRFGSALASVPDLNGDGYSEVVVGAPLEDDHRGAIYLFHGRAHGLHPTHKQRIAAVDVDPGLRYFGCSIHGKMDASGDGLVDLAVGSLGAVVLLWSRSVIRVHLSVSFEPSKINVFNKDCRRAGKDVTCMAAIVCVRVTAQTPMPPTLGAALRRSVYIDEHRFSPRAMLDDLEHLHSNITVLPDIQHCQQLHFHVQETSDYVRPVIFTMEVVLQDPDHGPVIDEDWPTTLRVELPFWNGCEEDEHCIPNLILHSHTDLLDLQQFCSQRKCSGCMVCEQQGALQGAERVMEATRRRMFVDARLENRGENAYGTTLRISFSPNLAFSSLVLKGSSDIQIDCYSKSDRSHHRICNVSTPFMRSQSQVSFRVEFELSRSVFLDYVQVTLEASSEGEERSLQDNLNNLYYPIKYEGDLLFTRDSNPTRFEIKPEPSETSPGAIGPTFNLSYQIQNLGLFPVEELQITVEMSAVTSGGNQLLHISHFHIDQMAGSHCNPSRSIPPTRALPEDLSLTPQLNRSNSVALSVQCSVTLPAQAQVGVSIGGWLHLHALLAVQFRKLELVTTASVELNPASPTFLHEARPTRHIILEIRKEEDYRIPIWIIIGSSLGGLLLLALLVLALWKVSRFIRCYHSYSQVMLLDVLKEATGPV
ncbi:integrin alpha-11-like [Alosa alosa]|uniref:integrin alpha-11-like n=1 Tax=Alosa alosa TaxID=278164 RepID=UPI0020154C9E|nr:integrin alpha-11-like [Alosa alosa]